MVDVLGIGCTFCGTWNLGNSIQCSTSFFVSPRRIAAPEVTFYVCHCVPAASNTCSNLVVAQRSLASMLLFGDCLKSWWLDLAKFQTCFQKVSTKSPVVSKRFQSSCKQTSSRLQTGSWFQRDFKQAGVLAKQIGWMSRWWGKQLGWTCVGWLSFGYALICFFHFYVFSKFCATPDRFHQLQPHLYTDSMTFGDLPMIPSQSVPSGKQTVCYWTWPFIVDVTIEHGDFP